MGLKLRYYAGLVILNHMLYTTRNICELFNLSPTAVKDWCETYSAFLSESARPGKEKHRAFTLDDLKVFSFIATHRKQNEAHDNIYLALANGERGELPSAYGDLSLSVDSREQLVLLEGRVQQLVAEIETLRPFRDENIELKALLKQAETQLAEAQAEIRRMERENAVLKYRLDSQSEAE
jgi:DNA-binding transcriptional MerR regulator